MKKKFWLVAILAAALLLLLGAAALASGSTCEHSWTINGDGTHTCRNCGATGACSGGKATCTQRAAFLKDLLHNDSFPFAFLP